MSLIQQALEKTSRMQETRTTPPVSDPKPWELDPSGAPLEKKLAQVQKKHVARGRLKKRILIGTLLVGSAAVFSFLILRGYGGHPGLKKSGVMNAVAPTAALQRPLQILSGPVYRLTGITRLGDKPMAVINEEIVGVGAILPGDAVVKEIGNGEVLLDVQGQDLRLRL